ncbi:MAG: hypothetical protein HC802_19195 [Caldilineaceae bacterium]|nr:hypothetical protein [Caldilineaceae bacterium]
MTQLSARQRPYALGHLYTDYPCAVTDELPRMAELLADPDGLVRQSAVNGLSICGDAAVPALTLVLAAPHQGARTRATGALRRIGTMAAARVLFGLLNDENYLVRMYAHEGLDEMGLLENVLLFT